MAIIGSYGTGKTELCKFMMEFASCDLNIFIFCGGRGNDVVHLYQNEKIMKKSILFVATSDMPIAMRESCLLMGFRAAEYFCSLGYKINLFVDSFTNWYEARIELFDYSYPCPTLDGRTSINVKVASLFEKVGIFENKALGKNGSISLFACDPYNDGFTISIQLCSTFIRLDNKLRNMRLFPAIDQTISFSKDRNNAEINSKFNDLRATSQKIINDDQILWEIISLVGVDSLQLSDLCTLHVAQLIKDIFLLQRFENDLFCSWDKTFAIMELILHYYELANTFISKCDERFISYSTVKCSFEKCFKKINKIKFSDFDSKKVEKVYYLLTQTFESSLEEILNYQQQRETIFVDVDPDT